MQVQGSKEETKRMSLIDTFKIQINSLQTSSPAIYAFETLGGKMLYRFYIYLTV